MFRSRSRTAWTTGAVTAAALTGALLTGTPAPAVSGDTPPTGSYAFTARIDIGNGTRACSGALIDPYWIITAASCFADNPAQPATVPAGPPALKTTATIGRTDPTTTGQVRDVAELVPRTDRDLVMARLANPVTEITPLALSAAAPVAGEELRVAGYGRTKTEWVPDQLHSAAFTVGAVDPTGLAITAKSPADAAVCKGDTGGPALRPVGDRYELAALNSRSWQNGCLGSTETTHTGAYDTRTDDLATWIQQTTSAWSAVMASRTGGRNTVYNPDTKTAEIFTLTTDGTMTNAHYNTDGKDWSGWFTIGAGGHFTGTPAVVYNPVTNAVELFAIGTDRSLYRTTWTRATGWGSWTMTGDWKFTDSPTTVYNPDTKTAEVFALTADGTMAHIYNTNGAGWSTWSLIGAGGHFTGTPAVVYNPVTNALELFAIGTDRSLYRTTWTRATGWGSWTMTGDWKFTDSPTTVYNPDTKTAEVFALTADGTMAHIYNTNGAGWSTWSLIGPSDWKFAGTPAVLYNPITNALELFATGTDRSLYRTTWTRTKGWEAWTMTGGWKFSGSPTTVYNPDTKTAEVFARITGLMAHASNANGAGWSDWSIMVRRAPK